MRRLVPFEYRKHLSVIECHAGALQQRTQRRKDPGVPVDQGPKATEAEHFVAGQWHRVTRVPVSSSVPLPPIDAARQWLTADATPHIVDHRERAGFRLRHAGNVRREQDAGMAPEPWPAGNGSGSVTSRIAAET